MVSPYLVGALEGLQKGLRQREEQERYEAKQKREDTLFKLKKDEAEFRLSELKRKKRDQEALQVFLGKLPGLDKEIASLEKKAMDRYILGTKELGPARAKADIQVAKAVDYNVQAPLEEETKDIGAIKTQKKQELEQLAEDIKKRYPVDQERLESLRTQRTQGLARFAAPQDIRKGFAARIMPVDTKKKLTALQQKVELISQTWPNLTRQQVVAKALGQIDIVKSNKAGYFQVIDKTGPTPRSYLMKMDQNNPNQLNFYSGIGGPPQMQDKRNPAFKTWTSIYSGSDFYKETLAYQKKKVPEFQTTAEMLNHHDSVWSRTYGFFPTMRTFLDSMAAQVSGDPYNKFQKEERRTRAKVHALAILKLLKSQGKALAQEQGRIFELLKKPSSWWASDAQQIETFIELQQYLEKLHDYAQNDIDDIQVVGKAQQDAIKVRNETKRLLSTMGDFRSYKREHQQALRQQAENYKTAEKLGYGGQHYCGFETKNGKQVPVSSGFFVRDEPESDGSYLGGFCVAPNQGYDPNSIRSYTSQEKKVMDKKQAAIDKREAFEKGTIVQKSRRRTRTGKVTITETIKPVIQMPRYNRRTRKWSYYQVDDTAKNRQTKTYLEKQMSQQGKTPKYPAPIYPWKKESK